VILGGGRRKFRRNNETDSEAGTLGEREDGINLIEKWKELKNGMRSIYVETESELLTVNTEETDYILGLFSNDHLGYLDEQKAMNDPSLEEMTRIAIEVLSKNPNGFFLFVEGNPNNISHELFLCILTVNRVD
jgi:alkaline phosphatase